MSPVDLSLPEAPPPRPRGVWIHWLTLVVAAATLTLLILNGGASRDGETTSGNADSTDALEHLAKKLEMRTLHAAASDVWAEYLEHEGLSPEERADALFSRAVCAKESGQYSLAARLFTEFEDFSASRDRKRSAGRHLRECLSALGKQEVRDHLARVAATGGDEEEEGTAVARIGREVITREEIRREMVVAAEEILRAQGAPLNPTELKTRAEELARQQMENPESARQAILQTISTNLLYREGLEQHLADDAELARALERFRRQYIVSRVVEKEREGALKAIGPTEIENHYEAHKERYVEPASVEFSFARFAAEEAARAALADPASIPFEKASGAAQSGAPVPGLGQAPEIAAHLAALEEGEVSDRPYEHAGAFYLFRAEKKTPQRTLTLEEAEPRVRAELAALKTREAITTLQEYLNHKYQVELLDASLAPTETESKDGAGGAEDGAEDQQEAADAKTAGEDTES